MGVKGLLGRLKPVASDRVDLNEDVGTIIFDGHYCMHRSAAKGSIALEFALEDNLRPLVIDMLVEMRHFEQAGWFVVVVFDGATPPSKTHTSDTRSGDRATALAACRVLKELPRPVDDVAQRLAIQELERRAKGAVAFTPVTVAKVSKMLQHSLQRAACVTAPFEADPQLKVMEELYSRGGKRCFVRANDSDLVVLGVRSLLWEVRLEAGGLYGQCIYQKHILQPEGEVWSGSSTGFDFLRQLHGVHRGTPEGDAYTWSSDEEAVAARLRNYACVAGNDYTKFDGIGPMRAMDIAIPGGKVLSIDEMAVGLVEASASLTWEVVSPQLKTSMDMFCHPVVWNPGTGAHQHLSGVESSAYFTTNTGTLAPPEVAEQIANQAICPKTREPWSESVDVNTDGLPPPVSLSGRGGRAGQGGSRAPGSRGRAGQGGSRAPAPGSRGRAGQGGSRAPGRGRRAGQGDSRGSGRGRAVQGRTRAPGRGGRASQGRNTLGGAEGNNYQRNGFETLPGADMDFSVWSVGQLRELLSAFRSLEMSGVSGLRKPQLVSLAKACVEVVREAGLVGSPIAFRHPVRSTQPQQPGMFPPPETVWLEWETLRGELPEISDNIIIQWLSDQGSLKGTTGRVLYRGLQRVLDFGALGGLFGLPPPGDSGGLLFLKFRANASMRGKEYDVIAALKVERVDSIDNTDGEEHGEEVDKCRYVATKVVRAYCECQSGAGGGCHHVAQLLQLTRLLQLTELELSQWNPKSPTSVACRWVLTHCGAGRDKQRNIMHCQPMESVVKSMRMLRDPKKHPLKGGVHERVHTRGVVAMDRADDYNAHPDLGMYSGPRRTFNEGATISKAQVAKLKKFIDGERKEFKRETDDGEPLQSVFSEVCADFLPAKTR